RFLDISLSILISSLSICCGGPWTRLHSGRGSPIKHICSFCCSGDRRFLGRKKVSINALFLFSASGSPKNSDPSGFKPAHSNPSFVNLIPVLQFCAKSSGEQWSFVLKIVPLPSVFMLSTMVHSASAEFGKRLTAKSSSPEVTEEIPFILLTIGLKTVSL